MFAPKSHCAEHLLHLRVSPFDNDTQPDDVGVVRLSLVCYVAGVRELHPHSQHVRAVSGQEKMCTNHREPLGEKLAHAGINIRRHSTAAPLHTGGR